LHYVSICTTIFELNYWCDYIKEIDVDRHIARMGGDEKFKQGFNGKIYLTMTVGKSGCIYMWFM